MSEEPNISKSDSDKVDWSRFYIISLITLVGFFSLCGSYGFEKAILIISVIYASFVTIGSNHYTDKVDKLRLIHIVVLVFYILSLIIIMSLIDNWELGLIFPSVTFCLWLLEVIWQKIFHPNKKE